MAKSKFSTLKGIKLYNALLRELGEVNKKAKKKQLLSPSERRKIVSEQLYPYFKLKGKVTKTDVAKQIRGVISKLPPAEICNPLYLAEAYLTAVEFFEIDNHIRKVLPQCLDVRVNAGKLGMTKIFNTSNYSYYTNGVQSIVEKIRDKTQNESDKAYFNGIVKVKPKRPDDANPANYFVDYVLYLNDTPVASEEGTDIVLPAKEKEKKKQVQDYLKEKFNTLQKEKRRRRRKAKAAQQKAKKQEPKEIKKRTNKAIDQAIASQRVLLRNKIITKAEFEKTVQILKGKKIK